MLVVPSIFMFGLDAPYDALMRSPNAMRDANRELLNEVIHTAFRAGKRG